LGKREREEGEREREEEEGRVRADLHCMCVNRRLTREACLDRTAGATSEKSFLNRL